MGNAVPGTFCDRVFPSCNPKPCLIRSPNFPGLYPRNLTCNYHLKQMQVAHSRSATLVLHQTNDYKISVPSNQRGSSISQRGSAGLTTDCPDGTSDQVRVYDGPGKDQPLLAKFCGDGVLQSIVSSGPEVLVQLYSAPYSVLGSSRVEIEATVRFEPETVSYMQKERSRCSYVIDANRHRRQGVIVSPKYTMPENSSCTYKFIGASSYDRIWIYFVSYLSRTMQKSSTVTEDDDTCDYSKLEMFNSHDKWPMVDISEGFDNFPMEFCGETRIPRMCPHTADYPPMYSPGRPCKFPEESYLSSGPTFAMKHTFLTTLDVVDLFSYSNFIVRYEFVDTRQDGVAISRTECDRRFDSRTAKGGFISNPKNIFLYGRGGRQNISCAFHFVGLPSERVRITLFNMRLSMGNSSTNCQSKFDNFTQRHVCRMSGDIHSNRSAFIRGIEYWDSHSSEIGCVCNTTSEKPHKFVFDSLVNNVKLVFSVNEMSALEDFTHFNFDAKFEFFNSTFCDTHVFDDREGLSIEGTIEFHVPHGRTNFTSGKDMLQPLRCRWQVSAFTERYLYLHFKGLDVTTKNCKNGMIVIVYGEDRLSKSSAMACVSADMVEPRDIKVFSASWFNDTLSIAEDDRKDFLFIEIVTASNWKGTRLQFRWMEVTKPFFISVTGRPLRNVECLFECPELGACIDPHLWCDRVEHCPTGFDESPVNCHPLAKGMEYLSLVVTLVAIGMFLTGILIAWAIVRHKHSHRNHHRRDDNEDDDVNEDSDDRTKDYDHRLSPTEDYPMENHTR
ncbi:hypothetical protein JTE90_005146 [Oedothorax gibbosus]|uniref:CUB domain-containing protein n=1 Tax=Oedothorax gibbosus TaxID=931172 RepID=A0AAV6UL72_9ARAC|nr:hypothetical protein JTE90_005146 [Oedothorax gibbosus]